MNELVRSGIGILSLLLILALTVLNTCQLDGMEQQVIKNSQMLDRITTEGVMATGGRAAGATSGAAGDDFYGSLTDEEAKLLNHPDNLLSKPLALAKAKNQVPGGAFRMAVGSDPPGLNRLASKNAADLTHLYFMMGSMVGYRNPSNPDEYIADLGLAVIENEVGLDYTIHIKRGVYWHEPAVDWESGRYDWLKGDHEVTSDDFKFSFDIIQNAQVMGRASSLRNYLEFFERIEIIDKYTFRLIFNKKQQTNADMAIQQWPTAKFLYMFDEDGNEYDETTWGLKLNEHWYNQKAIGTGPYKFVSWEPGVRILMERNERYHGARPSFDAIYYNIIKDQVAWPRKLKVGELDGTRMQPEQYRTEVVEAKGPILGNDKIKFTKYDTLGYFYIGWNADMPLFADKRVRRAMTHALNREGIVENVFHGLGETVSGPFGKQQPCYDQTIESWPYDLKEAARLLEEAGWTDTDGDGVRDKVIDGVKTPFEWTFTIYGSSNEWQTLANIYREDLMSVGVKMVPTAVEWSTMVKKMSDREFDAYSGAWVLGWDTDFMQIWHSQEADKAQSSNRIGFRNADADRIAETLRNTFDNEERVKLCHEFHAVVHEEQPYTFIYQRKRPFIYWDHLDPGFNPTWPHEDIRMYSFNADRP